MELVCDAESEAWDLPGDGSLGSPGLSPDGCPEGAERQGEGYFDTRWSHTAKYLRELASRKAAQAEEIRRNRTAIPVLNDDDRSALLSPFSANSFSQDMDGAVHIASGVLTAFHEQSPNNPLYQAALGAGRGGRHLPVKNPVAALLSAAPSTPGNAPCLDTLLESVLQRSTAVSSKLFQSCGLPSEKERLESLHSSPSAGKNGGADDPSRGGRPHARSFTSTGSNGPGTGERGRHPAGDGPAGREAHLRAHAASTSPGDSPKQQHTPQGGPEASSHSQTLPQLHPIHQLQSPGNRPSTRGSVPGSPLTSLGTSPLPTPMGWSAAFGSTIPPSPPVQSPLASSPASDVQGPFPPPSPVQRRAPSDCPSPRSPRQRRRSTEYTASALTGSATRSMPMFTPKAPAGPKPPHLSLEPETEDDGAGSSRLHILPVDEGPNSAGVVTYGSCSNSASGGERDVPRRAAPMRRKAPTGSSSFYLPSAARAAAAAAAAAGATDGPRSRSTSSDGSRPLFTVRPNSPVCIPAHVLRQQGIVPSRDGPSSCPVVSTRGSSTQPVHLPQLSQPSPSAGLRPGSSYMPGGAGATTAPPYGSGAGIKHISSLSGSRCSQDSGVEGAMEFGSGPSGEDSLASGMGSSRRSAWTRGQSRLQYGRSGACGGLMSPSQGLTSPASGLMSPSQGLMSPSAQSSWAKSTTTRELVYTRF